MIGPWTHGDFSSFSGELEFGMASSGLWLGYQGDLTEVHLRFFDRALGRPVRWPEMPTVEVFVMGENRWRYFPAWPVAEAQEERWYLSSGGHANTSAGDGRLRRQPPDPEGPDRYVYDPRDPVPTLGGSLLMPARYRPGPRDQRPNEARADVLCYTSEPFTEPYTVIGPVHATLHVASSAPDTDFVARLVDVYLDGRAIAVADGIVRARWRRMYSIPGEIRPHPPELLSPGEIAALTIDLWATGITFLPGHCLRLEVTSSSFPRWDRNLNTGGEEFLTVVLPVAAEQEVFHDPDHLSALTLPHVPD
jgi:putative CocE/NonD family hydrolase